MLYVEVYKKDRLRDRVHTYVMNGSALIQSISLNGRTYTCVCGNKGCVRNFDLRIFS